LFKPFVLFLGGEGAIDQGGPDAPLLESINLVLHQGDQGRNHDRQARPDQAWELVAEAFPAPRRHDAEAIIARNNMLDDLFLSFAETRQAEFAQRGR
jgi:hypothetical protein